MKRNEMLRLMIDCFAACTVMKYSIEQSMDRVLEICEENGMSPPDYDNTVYGYNEGFILPPEWEPEDE